MHGGRINPTPDTRPSERTRTKTRVPRSRDAHLDGRQGRHGEARHVGVLFVSSTLAAGQQWSRRWLHNPLKKRSLDPSHLVTGVFGEPNLGGRDLPRPGPTLTCEKINSSPDWREARFVRVARRGVNVPRLESPLAAPAHPAPHRQAMAISQTPTDATMRDLAVEGDEAFGACLARATPPRGSSPGAHPFARRTASLPRAR